MENKLLSVSVWGKNAMICDALATAFLILDAQKSCVIAEMSGVHAAFVDSDGHAVFSGTGNGMRKLADTMIR